MEKDAQGSSLASTTQTRIQPRLSFLAVPPGFQACHSGSCMVPVGTAIPVPSRAGVSGEGGAAG